MAGGGQGMPAGSSQPGTTLQGGYTAPTSRSNFYKPESNTFDFGNWWQQNFGQTKPIFGQPGQAPQQQPAPAPQAPTGPQWGSGPGHFQYFQPGQGMADVGGYWGGILQRAYGGGQKVLSPEELAAWNAEYEKRNTVNQPAQPTTPVTP